MSVRPFAWRRTKTGSYPVYALWRPSFWLFLWQRRRQIRHSIHMEAMWWSSERSGGPGKPGPHVDIRIPDETCNHHMDKDRLKESIAAFRKTYSDWCGCDD